MPRLETKPQTLGAALAEARRRLAAHSESPGADARVWLAHVTGLDAAALAAHPERRMNAAALDKWEAGLKQLEAGLPLPYMLGEWEFFGLPFKLTPDVLIPRPETELLVETALDWLRAHPQRRQAADVGTGSGCIAVALALAIDDLQLVATDVSPPALAVAASNLQRHGLGARVRLIETDLLVGMAGPFDLICANLPYIPSQRLPHLAVARHEPLVALDGGLDGLVHIRRLLEAAPRQLAPGGLLLAEIDDTHSQSASALAATNFPDAEVFVRRDLADRPRLLSVQT